MGREVPARGRVLMPMAPQDTQLAWVAGPEQSLQKMHPQLVITILLGLDCDEENMATVQFPMLIVRSSGQVKI